VLPAVAINVGFGIVIKCFSPVLQGQLSSILARGSLRYILRKLYACLRTPMTLTSPPGGTDRRAGSQGARAKCSASNMPGKC